MPSLSSNIQPDNICPICGDVYLVATHNDYESTYKHDDSIGVHFCCLQTESAYSQNEIRYSNTEYSFEYRRANTDDWQQVITYHALFWWYQYNWLNKNISAKRFNPEQFTVFVTDKQLWHFLMLKRNYAMKGAYLWRDDTDCYLNVSAYDYLLPNGTIELYNEHTQKWLLTQKSLSAKWARDLAYSIIYMERKQDE